MVKAELEEQIQASKISPLRELLADDVMLCVYKGSWSTPQSPTTDTLTPTTTTAKEQT